MPAPTRTAGRSVVIRPYDDQRDFEATLRLRAASYPGWREAADADWHRSVYRWLGTAPDAELMHRWVLEVGGDVVGHLAAVPLRYRIGGKSVLAHTPTDYMVLPGHGFHAVALMRTFFQACPSYVACNVAGQVSTIERAFGSTVVGPLTQCVKVMDIGNYPRLPRPVPRPLARVAAAGLRLVDRAILSRPPKGVRVETIETFDGSFDTLLDAVAGAVPCTPEKGARFLNWRYGPGTPRTPLTLLAARDGRGKAPLAGYAVLRTTSQREGFILDLLTMPGRRDAARALLAAAARRFWRDGAFVARYRFTPSVAGPTTSDLRSMGYLVGGGSSGSTRGLPGTQPERQLELLVRLEDPAAQAEAVRLEHWAYNLGDGEASFWVH